MEGDHDTQHDSAGSMLGDPTGPTESTEASAIARDCEDPPRPPPEDDPQATVNEFLDVSIASASPLERMISQDLAALSKFAQRYQHKLEAAMGHVATLSDLAPLDTPTKRWLQIHNEIHKRSQLLHKIETTPPPVRD